MKFIQIAPETENLIVQKFISENGLVVLSRWRVMYGYRLLVAMADDWAGNYAEICCGDNDLWFAFALRVIAAHIAYNFKEGKPYFDGIPRSSNIKPWAKDPEFTQILLHMPLEEAELVPAAKELQDKWERDYKLRLVAKLIEFKGIMPQL